LNEYVKVHRFNLAIDPEILLKQVHPFHGHATKLDGLIVFEDLFALFEKLVIASFEKLQGQTLLASEICAFAHWVHRDRNQNGYLEIQGAKRLMKTFDIKFESWDDFTKEFEFALAQGRNRELFSWKDNGLPAGTFLPFDFFRYIYLERNF